MSKRNRKAIIDDGMNPELIYGASPCDFDGILQIPIVRSPIDLPDFDFIVPFSERERKNVDKARSLLEKDFTFVLQEVKAHNCLNGELVNRKFDKGLGVRLIAEHFGVGIEDTYGFGDSMNDREMIETVGTSVCMENGAEALKKISDMICPSVSEDGLAKAFAQLSLI